MALLAFLATQGILACILAYMDYSYFNNLNWIRADSGHYLAIAKKGYEFMSCSGIPGFGDDSIYFCGNTGWFPGYPYLIRLATYFGGSAEVLGAIISKVFLVGTLILILVLADVKSFSFKAFLLLFSACFFFGGIYYNAVFPISAVLFFVLLAFYFVMRHNLWAGSLSILICSFLYPTGFLLAVVIVTYLVLIERSQFLLNAKKAVLPLASGLLGVLLFFTILHFEVGHWDAFIKVQDKYGHGIHNPITNIYKSFSDINLKKLTVKDFPHLQSALVLLAYLMALIAFAFMKQFRRGLQLLVFIYFTLYILFPWTIGGNLSMYRAEALLLPSVFLITGLSTRAILIAVLLLLIVYIPMSFLFFDTTLI